MSASESPPIKITCLYILLLSWPSNVGWNILILLPPPAGLTVVVVVVVVDVLNRPCAVLLEQHWGNHVWNQSLRLVLMSYGPPATFYILIRDKKTFDSFSFFSSSSVLCHCFSHILSAFLNRTVSLAEMPVIARTEPQLELRLKRCLL